MSKHVRLFVGGCVAVAAMVASAPASAGAVALGGRVGTTGLGLEGTIGLSDRFNLRVPFNTFDYDYDSEEDGIEYEGKAELQSFGAALDFHPFKGSFFLSAGLFSNGNELSLKASDPTGTEAYEIGDDETVYFSDPSNPLALNAGADFGSTAPYVGLGWGNPIQGDWNLYFRFELGAYFQQSPDVSLTASGRARDSNGTTFDVNGQSPQAAQLRADLEEERASLENDLNDFDIYPVVAFSIGYRFKF